MSNNLLFTLFPFFPNTNSETLNFKDNLVAKGIFFQSLILYDTVTIPTQSLSELTVLGHWLGYDILFELINDKRIRFLKQDGRIIYSGETKTLETIRLFRLEWPEDKSRYFAAASMYTPPEAADIILTHNREVIDNPLKNLIINGIDRSAIAGEHPLLLKVKEQTENDINQNHKLAKHLDLYGKEISQLKGINVNQARIGLGSENLTGKDDISKLLTLTFLNCILIWGKVSNVNNYHVQKIFEPLISIKSSGLLRSKGIAAGVDSILVTKKIPDFAALVSNQSIDAYALLRIVKDPKTEEFRKWIH